MEKTLGLAPAPPELTADAEEPGRAVAVRAVASPAAPAGDRLQGTLAAADAALVAACRAGDRAAMRRLYERHWRRVASLVGRIAGAEEAEELTQEVFLKLFRALDGFRGDAQLSTWIHRMAVNAALSHKTRSPSRHHVSDGEEAIARLSAPAGVERDPRLRRRLEEAIARLPPGYRAVLVLHDVEGLEHEEVAAVMGTSVGTSKSQLHKARAKMRELLGPDGAAALRAITDGGTP